MSETQSIEALSQDLLDEFLMFDDWMDRYQHLIDLGKELEQLDEAYRTDVYKISGCQSQVWLQPCSDGKMVWFKADSDAQITKGLIAVLLRVLNHHTASDVVTANLGFLEELELKEHLSPTRKNGLDAMIRQIRLHAAQIEAHGSADL